MSQAAQYGRRGAGIDDPAVTPHGAIWPWVERGLEDILQDATTIKVRAADVKQTLDEGTTVLWTTAEGFVISTGSTEWPSGRRVFLIWWAWAVNRGTDLVQKHYPFFARVAKEAGFSAIEVRTTTDAVAEHLQRKGWIKSTTTMTREL